MAVVDSFLGDPGLAPAMRALSVKGNLVRWRRRYLEERFGAGALHQVLGRLSGPAKAMLEDPPPHFAWCSLGEMMDVDRAILEGPLGGDLSDFRAFGRHVGEGDLSTVYRLILRIAVRPPLLMRKFGEFYSNYFRPGSGWVAHEEPGCSALEIDGPLPLYLCTHGILGWVDAGMSLIGAPKHTIEHDACVHRGDERCRWTVRW